PITLDTPSGPLGISPGPADLCEVNCDQIYAGAENNGCSDCGPGYGDSLAPGTTVDIPWDRRVYMEITADPKCSGHPSGNDCALGALAGAAVSTGTPTVCNDGLGSPTGGSGYCSTQAEQMVRFMFDPSKDDPTIDVQ